MKNNSLISVIIPVYQAEKWLHKCLNSIVCQTYKEIEIIAVDDGSSDNCGRICEEYAFRDSRVRVLHQQNRGVSAARQAGLNLAKGDYVIYVDSDDWVEHDMISKLYDKAIQDEVDVVICDYFEDRNNKSTYISQKPKSLENRKLLIQLLNQQLHGSCCNKLVKRDCYDKYNVKFPVGINIYEDLFVMCQFVYNGAKVSYLPNAFYHYNLAMNDNSLSMRISMKGVEEKMKFVDMMNQLICMGETEKLYIIKKSILRDLFQLNQKQLLQTTYREIHKAVINEGKNYHLFTPHGYVLSMALKNRYVYAHFCFLLSLFFIKIKNLVKKRFLKTQKK